MIVADSRSPEPESEGPVDFTIKNEQLCSSPETPQVKLFAIMKMIKIFHLFSVVLCYNRVAN